MILHQKLRLPALKTKQKMYGKLQHFQFYSRLNGCIENKYINSNENVDHTVTIVKDLGFCDFPKREQNQKTYEIIVCVIIGQNFVHYMVQWSNLD